MRLQEAAFAATAGVHDSSGLCLGLCLGAGVQEKNAGLLLGLSGLHIDERAAAGAQGEALCQRHDVGLIGFKELPLWALLAEQIIPAQRVRRISTVSQHPCLGRHGELAVGALQPIAKVLKLAGATAVPSERGIQSKITFLAGKDVSTVSGNSACFITPSFWQHTELRQGEQWLHLCSPK